MEQAVALNLDTVTVDKGADRTPPAPGTALVGKFIHGA